MLGTIGISDARIINQVLDVVPNGVVVLDRKGQIVYANENAEQILGLTREDMSQKSYDDPTWQITSLDGGPFPEEELPFARVRATRAPVFDIEHGIRWPDGRRVLLSVNASPLLDDEGKLDGVVSTIVDITKRHDERRRLAESEQRFRNVVEASPMGMHLYRLDEDGGLIFEGANPAADRLLGVENAQFVGMRLEEAFPPLADTEVPARYRAAARDGELWQTQQIDYADDQIRGAFEVYAFQTEPGRMVALFLDITERLRMERRLAASEERFRLMVHHSTDVLAIVNRDRSIRFVSPAIENVTGKTAEALAGAKADDEVHPDDHDAVARLGSHEAVEVRIQRADGSWVWVEAVMADRLTDPLVEGYVLNLRDVTERKRLETERQELEGRLHHSAKMEAVGQLAGGIAHDFNNLLTGILGYTDLLLMESDAPELGEVRRAAEQAASLTAQLLAFSRRQVIAPEVVNLCEVIERSGRMIERLIGEDITLTFCPSLEPTFVKVDPGQVEQVLVNLAVNARDAMPEGGKLTLETARVTLDEDYCASHADTVPGRYVLLAVSDSGHGMDSETQRRIFEPFFTTKGKGTGLGLATVYGVVRQNQGFLEVYSEPDVGTTFKIYLPAVSEAAPTPEAPAPVARGGTETILLVEDEEVVRALGRKILTRGGYDVLVAKNVEEALAAASDAGRRIDLLLTDVIMPDTNGRELYETLAQSRPTLKVLYVSGYTANVIAHHGVLEPGVNFLQKPFSVEGLAAKVREVLDN